MSTRSGLLQEIASPGVEVVVSVPAPGLSLAPDPDADRREALAKRMDAALRFHGLEGAVHDPVVGPQVVDLAGTIAEYEVCRAEAQEELDRTMAAGDPGSPRVTQLLATIARTAAQGQAIEIALGALAGTLAALRRERAAHRNQAQSLAGMVAKAEDRYIDLSQAKNRLGRYLYEAFREAVKASVTDVPLLPGEIERVEEVVGTGVVPPEWKHDPDVRRGDPL